MRTAFDGWWGVRDWRHCSRRERVGGTSARVSVCVELTQFRHQSTPPLSEYAHLFWHAASSSPHHDSSPSRPLLIPASPRRLLAAAFLRLLASSLPRHHLPPAFLSSSPPIASPRPRVSCRRLPPGGRVFFFFLRNLTDLEHVMIHEDLDLAGALGDHTAPLSKRVGQLSGHTNV